MIVTYCCSRGLAWSYAAKADDLERKGGRALRQAGFVYVAADDFYRCPAGERLTYRYTNEEDSKRLRRYWTTACADMAVAGSFDHLVGAAGQRKRNGEAERLAGITNVTEPNQPLATDLKPVVRMTGGCARAFRPP